MFDTFHALLITFSILKSCNNLMTTQKQIIVFM